MEKSGGFKEPTDRVGDLSLDLLCDEMIRKTRLSDESVKDLKCSSRTITSQSKLSYRAKTELPIRQAQFKRDIQSLLIRIRM